MFGKAKTGGDVKTFLKASNAPSVSPVHRKAFFSSWRFPHGEWLSRLQIILYIDSEIHWNQDRVSVLSYCLISLTSQWHPLCYVSPYFFSVYHISKKRYLSTHIRFLITTASSCGRPLCSAPPPGGSNTSRLILKRLLPHPSTRSQSQIQQKHYPSLIGV